MSEKTVTTPDGKMRIQGYNPVPDFARALNNRGEEEYNTAHVEDCRLTIERRGTDAVVSVGGKSVLIPRFDNHCVEIISFLREPHGRY